VRTKLNGFSLTLACRLLLTVSVAAEEDGAGSLKWQKLAPIPDQQGFAGCFAGVSGGALVVAGGANISGDKWGDTFTKKWSNSIFVLEQPDGHWISARKLERPLGYGVSVSFRDGLICLGGSDAKQHYADVIQLQWDGREIKVSRLPSLPGRFANACGALLDGTIYVAGGAETPTATRALSTFWALKLDDAEPRWRELEPWPGPDRIFAVAGVYDGSFYLFSGARLSAGPDGKAVREYLRDAYRFTPGRGWKRLADLPRAAVAAPSPAPAIGDALLVMTGDDGTKVDFKPLVEHPGFPRDVLKYDVKKNAWSTRGQVPFSRATVPVVQWLGHFVLPNGEVRPRERTPEVWWAKSYQ
jgi:N-acetylneuraminic acid mutarotase